MAATIHKVTHLVTMETPSPGARTEVHVPLCNVCQKDIQISNGLCSRDCKNDGVAYTRRPKGDTIMRVYEYKFLRDEVR